MRTLTITFHFDEWSEVTKNMTNAKLLIKGGAFKYRSSDYTFKIKEKPEQQVINGQKCLVYQSKLNYDE